MKFRYDLESETMQDDQGFVSKTELEAVNRAIQHIEAEMVPWIKEAKTALDLEDIYRGGGVLKLAELMRKHSHLKGLRKAYESQKAA